MPDYGEIQEEKERWRQRKDNGNAGLVFQSTGSSTHNPKALAQILALLDLSAHQLGWDIPKKDKAGNIIRPAFIPSLLLNAYQAGIDGKYHKDFVDIAKLDEYIQKKALMRKAQMMQDNTLMT
jgi:hypothetical protein